MPRRIYYKNRRQTRTGILIKRGVMLVALLTVATGAMCAWWWFRREMGRRARVHAQVPALPGALPLLGHAHVLLGDSEDLFKFVTKYSEITNKLGGIAKMWLGPRLFFLVTDPVVANTLMNSCLQKNYMYNFAKPWIGEGLFTVDAVRWKQQRKLLNPTFGQRVLDGYLRVFSAQARALAAALEPRAGTGLFDVMPLLNANALETICRTVMGLPTDGMATTVDTEYARATDKILEIMMYRVQRFWMHFDFLYNRSSIKREEQKLVQLLQSTSINMLKNLKESSTQTSGEKENTDDKFKSFLELVVNLHREGRLSERESREHLDTMIVGGYDTTATTLLYNLLAIGNDQRVQDNVFQELQAVFEGSNRDVTKEDLSKLVYLEAVIKEVSRLYPIGAAIAREVRQDVKFEDYTIPAGSDLILLIWGMHRHACWGSDATALRPERWLAGGGVGSARGAGGVPEYGAFGTGRRTCIGKMYAIMSLKASLATVLRQYRVRGEPAGRLRLKFDLLTKPVAGHHVAFELR